MTSGTEGDSAAVGRPAGSSTSPAEASTLIASKLSVPPTHDQAVARPRVEARIAAGVRGRLTLVIAPAGYGKTTLVTSWLASRPTPAAWVSLDVQDNNPPRFWAYVTAAVRRAGVQLPTAPDGGDPIVPLVNGLATLPGDLVLVLDDYHLITAPEVHRDLGFLLDQNIEHLHVVLISRSDPTFVRPRWKANGQVTELRVRDLTFTDDEAGLFLDDQDIAVDPTLRRQLLAKVGGWAAALRLLTIWMAGRPDADAALAQFASGDATIADYLVAEVLSQLPPATREFLIRTSILPRLTGSLCEALTDTTDGQPSGTRTLEELYRRDLFVQAVDDRHHVFRYHPLFAELLRNELHRTAPDLVPDLHRRASQWFAGHGDTEDAIDQAILGHDWPAIRALLLAETLAIGARHQHAMVEGWLAALPADVVAGSPFFQMLHGYIQATLGRTTVARRTLAAVHVTAARTDAGEGLPELIALTHAIEAGIARLEADLPATRVSHAATMRELDQLGTPESGLSPMTRAVADTALAGALFWAGDPAARPLAERAETDAAARGLHRMRVNALGSQALVLAAAGRLREATALVPEVLHAADAIGVTTSFQTTPALLASAVVATYRGDNDAALPLLEQVTARAVRHGDRGPQLAATVLTARLLNAAGDSKAAFSVLDDAAATWPGWTPPPPLRAVVLAEHARISLSVGDLGSARTLLADLDELPSTPWTTTAAVTTRARLTLAEGRYRVSAAAFARIAEADASLLTRTEALVAASVASERGTQPAQALHHLARALAAACDEGILAPFAWHAADVRPLLMRIELGAGDIAGTGFRQRLLEHLGVPSRPRTDDTRGRTATDILSERELVVLRMLRGTLSNTDIAATLSISPNTLKSHVKSINRKLGTRNRQGTVARAGELGLR